jgi:hypothetical protein
VELDQAVDFLLLVVYGIATLVGFLTIRGTIPSKERLGEPLSGSLYLMSVN